jgi:flagellar basal body L-ring protein FlgH
MPLTQKRLVGPAAFATSAGDIYTVPYNVGYVTTVVIKEIILCNTSASAQTVTLYLKPKSVAVASSHIFINSLTLAANETVTISTSMVLTNSNDTAGDTYSDKIRGLASAVTVNYILNGYEEY